MKLTVLGKDRKQQRYSHRARGRNVGIQLSWNQASCATEAVLLGVDFDGPQLAEEASDSIVASHLLDAEFRPLFEGDGYFNVKKEM